MDAQLQRDGFSYWHRYYLRSQTESLPQVNSFRWHTRINVDKNYNYNIITDLLVSLSFAIKAEMAIIPIKYAHRIEIPFTNN